MDDLVIGGGEILDGSGTDAVRGDLAIRDGRIVAITPCHAGTAHREIDARGSIVAPGFIDIKTHSDFTLPYAPRAESKILQGVTTEVIGHCGLGNCWTRSRRHSEVGWTSTATPIPTRARATP